ncbi:glycosyltransferase family 2 protein [Escherichia coli]|uniref:glycosyltransferase n=1 Tax=Escherichia coli TaxID=562 RepID=UPI00226494F4|nr:glycosyltransferase family 2 protein [Escherichia coli]MCX8224307.1 glycosyltransferase family 2 protein [Escherichia coli]
MDNFDIVILILNYNTYRETVECVEMYKLQREISLKFVIVDNNSGNNSFDFLKQHYLKDDSVDVISSGRNDGYAAGNNYGLAYIKDNYNFSDYIIISNNDVVLRGNSSLSNLVKKYEGLDDVACLAPLMYENGKVSSYSDWNLPTIFNCMLQHSILLSYLSKKFLKKNRTNRVGTYKVDCVPGSLFLIKKELMLNLMFDENTFLYMEESILAKKIKDLNLKNYISSDLIYDHEHGATISKYNNNDKKYKFLLDSQIYYLKNYVGVRKGYINLLKFTSFIGKLERKLLLKRLNN